MAKKATKSVKAANEVQSVPPVLLAREGTSMIARLNRPEQMNAINSEIIAGLHDALDRALDDEQTRSVIITAQGSTFCAGVDVVHAAEEGPRSYDESLAEAEELARLFRRLRSYEKVTIAAVNGAALGSGCCLATLCDFTLAVGAARFGYPDVRYGFVPAVVAVFLRGFVNAKRMRDLLLTGRILSADEAHEIGLVSEVVPHGGLMIRALDVANMVSQNAPRATRMTKELLEMLPDMDIDKALRAAVDFNARNRDSAEVREGLSAHAQRRAPDWNAARDADEGRAQM